MTYKTKGVCSSEINFELQNGTIKSVSFKGGCDGNLKGLSSLVVGMSAEEAIKRLKGITCGHKSTSCPDQLATALSEVIQ